jgi:Ca-activated chloride channel family protein
MSRWSPVLLVGLLCAAPVQANGLLVPGDASLPPLALVKHEVRVRIDEQVACTEVTQTFRNHTDRALEATYLFPVPKGASVTRFSMWVNGKEEKGELVEADKARQIYTDIVRRAQDPGLLEYVGNNLLKVRVFPVPAHGDQKLRLRFTALADRDGGLVRYVYPLRSNEKAAQALEAFSLDVTLKSSQAIQNLYSPTHAVTVQHQGDREAHVRCRHGKTTLDRDFELYWGHGGKDVGLTALAHRPDAGSDGHVLLLLSPRAELARTQKAARDFVFVLDTSSSMAGPKMEQAKKALAFCLRSLRGGDRFALLHFATTVNRYRDGLTPVNAEEIGNACQWTEALEANGGTAINDALADALGFRTTDAGRTFTVVFFTDGQPTVGENNPEKILKNTLARNTANTRIFTFGVGDDVNAVLLDRLADETRAVSTYVRPEEDIEVKVGDLYGKISHPVLTDLKLKASDNITLAEMYPPRLPDLFHGGQLVVLARFRGEGHAAITLTGKVGKRTREYVYEVNFPKRTKNDRAFVEGLWARRKVGYLLDQVRTNGENKELVSEVVKLARKYGITTPYTSYLCVPDQAPTPVLSQALSTPAPPQAARPMNVPQARYLAHNTVVLNSTTPVISAPAPAPVAHSGDTTYSYPVPPPATAQTGKEGVDLALQLKELCDGEQPAGLQTRRVAGRTCVAVNGTWTDQGFTKGMPTVKIKALSEACFRLLARHPELKEVFALGTRILWVTPSGTALAVDPAAGKEQLGDEEIARLFASKKPG